MKIDEGRLELSRCPDCGGFVHRAFGESESKRSELASYAIGWTSGPEHDIREGVMTVGIGVGNVGGGSFHMQVRLVDDEPAFRLVDEPFERVPEGGPDLTRDEALEHGDLEYVWFVADNVMLQDARALWMAHWLARSQAGATRAVVDGAPVVAVRRDDGGWYLSDVHDLAAAGEDVELADVVDVDPTLAAALPLVDLPIGGTVVRDTPGDDWRAA